MSKKRDFGDRVQPQQKMARNAPCWCGSGLKWKKCHRDRSALSTTSFFDVVPKLKNTFSKGQCLHPDAPSGCSGHAIRSHTVQKGYALKAIAENGHVFSCKESVDQIAKMDGNLVPKRTGINLASTFPGFCSKHDTELFLPIEAESFVLSKEGAFLLSYRAMAYELHAKQAQVASLPLMRQADAGRSFFGQANIQDFIASVTAGARAAVDDLVELKRQLDANFSSKNYENMEAHYVEFDELLPFVAAFPFMPEYDFSGENVQSLLDDVCESVTLTVAVTDARSCAVFAWKKGDELSKRFVDSFVALSDDIKASALLRFCVAQAENVHLRPSWWEGLSDGDRAEFLRLMRLGLPDVTGVRRKNDFIPVADSLVLKAKVIKSVRMN